MNISRPALTGLVIGAVLFATAVSASAEFPGSQAAAAGRGFAGGPLENWMTAIERHVPGTADAPAVTVSESAGGVPAAIPSELFARWRGARRLAPAGGAPEGSAADGQSAPGLPRWQIELRL